MWALRSRASDGKGTNLGRPRSNQRTNNRAHAAKEQSVSGSRQSGPGPAGSQLSNQDESQGPLAPAGEEYSLRDFLAEIVARTEVPFGFSIAVWAAHILVTRDRGEPSDLGLLLFVAGAIAGLWFVAYALAWGKRGRSIAAVQDSRLAWVTALALFATVAILIGISSTDYFGQPNLVAFSLSGVTVGFFYVFFVGLIEYTVQLAQRRLGWFR